MKDNLLDCIKIFGRNGHLLSVINLNNMIPVKAECLSPIIFKNEPDPFQIQKFQNQYRIIKKLAPKICSNAKTLYYEYRHHPDSSVSKRCYNFQLLEEKYLSYFKDEQILKVQTTTINHIKEYCQAIQKHREYEKELEK